MAGEGRARSVVIVKLGEGAKRWQARGLEEDDETEGVFVLRFSCCELPLRSSFDQPYQVAYEYERTTLGWQCLATSWQSTEYMWRSIDSYVRDRVHLDWGYLGYSSFLSGLPSRLLITGLYPMTAIDLMAFPP